MKTLEDERKYQKEYREKNKEKSRNYQREYMRERREKERQDKIDKQRIEHNVEIVTKSRTQLYNIIKV